MVSTKVDTIFDSSNKQKHEKMKKVKFNELDYFNMKIAIAQIVAIKKETGYPIYQKFDSGADIGYARVYGVDPDEYFSFYLNDFYEVTVKIG